MVDNGLQVTAVSFNYGSKHNKYENDAAQQIAGYYKIKLIELDISQAMAGIASNLMKSGGPIPEGDYQDETMKKTVVPARNMIFISILAGIAESRKINTIGLGVHAGDHAIYPDCRPKFISTIAESVRLGTDRKVQGIQAPFVLMNKAQIIKIGIMLNHPVPFYLTRTCYKDQPIACGVCGSCRERLEAFHLNRMKDPLKYERVKND